MLKALSFCLHATEHSPINDSVLKRKSYLWYTCVAIHSKIHINPVRTGLIFQGERTVSFWVLFDSEPNYRMWFFKRQII